MLNQLIKISFLSLLTSFVPPSSRAKARDPVRKALKIFFALLALFTVSNFLSACQSGEDTKKIGLIIPIEHQAMNEITAGFIETLKQTYPQAKFKVANAQGDINLQRALIQQMQAEHYDLIAPVGTSPTQMAVAMVQNQPIVSLAAAYTDAERKQRKVCNVALVHDEIKPDYIIQFIHAVYPNIKHITLIHSPNDKIYADIKKITFTAKKLNIEVTSKMVATLSELYSAANALPVQTQAILVLKDHLIVSGITTLANAAKKNQIPLITSDQGSVEAGAGLALGVTEREIGVRGAALAARVLAGEKPCDLPVSEMQNFTVFMNAHALLKVDVTPQAVKKQADKFHYQFQLINGENHV